MWFMKKKRSKGKRKYTKNDSTTGRIYQKDEKLKLLKEYEQIGAPMPMFCKWYGVGLGTFKSWQEKYQKFGEEGLEDNRGGRTPQEIPEAVKEEIVKIKVENPGIGVQKISDYLLRNNFVKICRENIEKVLKDNPKTSGMVQKKRLRHGNSEKEPQSFERSKPGDMYQMDIMTFHLKGLYKLYVIACLDDYSRFVVSLGVFRSQTADRVLDVLKGAIERYGMPKEILTDNGRQFYTWRGKSEFQKYLIKSGITHIRSRPYHPQTCGKVESLWRNMYQELLSKEPIASFEEMQEKVEKWVEWYNFKRPHQGIGGLVPADRFFSVEGGVREMIEKGARMVKDALIVDPRKIKKPMYLIGRIGEKEIRVIAKEGSVMVEGLDTVEEKKETKGETENGTGESADGANTGEDKILSGNTTGGEIPGSADGSGQEKESEADLRGDGYIAGNIQRMEEKGNGRDSERIPEAGEERQKAEGLREGRETEGRNGKSDYGTEGVGKEDQAAGGREKESDTGTMDSQESDGIL